MGSSHHGYFERIKNNVCLSWCLLLVPRQRHTQAAFTTRMVHFVTLIRPKLTDWLTDLTTCSVTRTKTGDTLPLLPLEVICC